MNYEQMNNNRVYVYGEVVSKAAVTLMKHYGVANVAVIK